MQTETENSVVDIKVVNPRTQQELGLCAFTGQRVDRVLELGAKRLGFASDARGLEALIIRREGELLGLDRNALVADALRAGDRLVVEPLSGNERISAEAEDDFATAAADTAGTAVSADSATFLKQARQHAGE